MPEIFGFTGGAGTGKTYSIVQKLEELTAAQEWTEFNAILAITFMHGSKKRLAARLQQFRNQGIRVSCMTIDAFCHLLVNQFQVYSGGKPYRYSEFLGNDEINELETCFECGLNPIRSRATELLNMSVVRSCTSVSFPIIVIDEFQDVDAMLFQIIEGLSGASDMIIGADGFQDLSNSDYEDAMLWLEELEGTVELDVCHRTNAQSLLRSATALRTNEQLSDCVECRSVPSHNLAAWNIVHRIWRGQRWGRDGKTLAVLSPRRMNEAFTRNTILRARDPFPNSNLQGYNIRVEFENQRSLEETMEDLGISNEPITKENAIVWMSDESALLNRLARTILRLLNLRGDESISNQECKELLSKIIFRQNQFGHMVSERGVVFTTVHGAKNREFDHVIVLWPHAVQPDVENQRRLLYNAITRAKQGALVLVQGNDGRLNSDPIRLLRG